jgi:hypothetical protein
MTAAENQAIQILSAHLQSFIEENRSGHQEIKDFIKDVKEQLCKKIEEKDVRIREIVEHCKQREIYVDSLLAERTKMFEAKIAAAEAEAISMATRPSETRVAGKWLGRLTVRFVTVAALFVGFFATLLLVLERLHVL